MTFETLTNVRADELCAGDWPVSIAGYRPITRVVNKPRKREVVLTIDGHPTTLPHHHVVKRVRRPHGAPAQAVRKFDPFDTQVR